MDFGGVRIKYWLLEDYFFIQNFLNGNILVDTLHVIKKSKVSKLPLSNNCKELFQSNNATCCVCSNIWRQNFKLKLLMNGAPWK